MVIGIGVDIIEPSRIRGILERHGERFLKRLYTEGEIAYCQGRKREVEHLAVRFAAKEAAGKALGTGLSQGITWKDIEVTKDNLGAPHLALHGEAKKRADALGVTRMHVSLSHSERSAVAVVVLEAESAPSASGRGSG